MRRTLTFVVCAAILSACSGKSDTVKLGGTAVTQPTELPKSPKLQGTTLPDLAFIDFKGNPVRLAELKGVPTVINVWSETCEPCKAEMPAFELIHRAVTPRIRFVGIDSQDSFNNAKQFAEKTGVTYDLWRDPTGEFLTKLKLVALPTTLITDANGTVVWMKTGSLSGEQLQAKLTELVPA